MLADLQRISQRPFYPTPTDCKVWTYFLNHLLFRGQVPRWNGIKITKLQRIWGWCVPKDLANGERRCTLRIHQKFPTFTVFYRLLIHEMVHYLEYHEKGTISHGKFFLEHMARIHRNEKLWIPNDDV